MRPSVRCGLVQCSDPITDEPVPVARIQQATLDNHLPLIEQVAAAGVPTLCPQEIFSGPHSARGHS